MGPSYVNVLTSNTLLEKLRDLGNREAWSRFMGLYLPLIRPWGRRHDLPKQDVEELTGRLLAKLVEKIPKFRYDPDKGDSAVG